MRIAFGESWMLMMRGMGFRWMAASAGREMVLETMSVVNRDAMNLGCTYTVCRALDSVERSCKEIHLCQWRFIRLTNLSCSQAWPTSHQG